MPIIHDGKNIVDRLHGGAPLVKKYHGDRLVWTKRLEYRLPFAYQEVEYIRCSGNQWLITNIIPTGNSDLRATFQYTGGAITESARMVAGSLTINNNKTTINRLYVGVGKAEAKFISAFGDERVYRKAIDKEVHALIADAKNGKAVIDNESYSGVTNWNKNFKNPKIAIGSYSSSTDVSKPGAFIGKIFSVLVYENDNCVGNFVPCYRKSDHKAGMYDTISDTFFSSVTNADFFVGADVKCSKLEYIESKGDQYINLHLIPKITHSFSTKVKITDKSIANNMIIGSRTTGTYQTSDDQIYMNWQKVDKRIVLRNRFNSNVIYFEEGADGFFNLTKVKNENCQLENPRIPYFVFALNKLGEPDAFACCQIYFFEIYDNDVLKMNLIPYKIGDTAGLLDTVSKVFFTGELVGKPFVTKESRRR